MLILAKYYFLNKCIVSLKSSTYISFFPVYYTYKIVCKFISVTIELDNFRNDINNIFSYILAVDSNSLYEGFKFFFILTKYHNIIQFLLLGSFSH